MNVIQTAVNRAVQMLVATGVEFEVRMPDGTVYGGLSKPEKASMRGKRNLKRPFGAGTKLYNEMLGNLKVGEVGVIKLQPGFTLQDIQSGATSWATVRWGKGSYVSSRTDGNTAVEILRVL
jgi:hypothetical protein